MLKVENAQLRRFKEL